MGFIDDEDDDGDTDHVLFGMIATIRLAAWTFLFDAIANPPCSIVTALQLQQQKHPGRKAHHRNSRAALL